MIRFQYVAKTYFLSLRMKMVLKNTVSILFVVSVLFSACTGKKMSGEDAKQVTVSMSDESFIPPPRRINDILSVLSQTGQNESDIVKKQKIMTAQIPPRTEDEGQLAGFYYRRGLAALQLFRFTQALEDLKIALNYFERLSFLNIDEERLLQGLGIAEIQAGNFRRGVQLIERSVKVPKTINIGTRDLRIRGFVKLVRAYFQIGDLEMVEVAKNRGIRFLNFSHGGAGHRWSAGMEPRFQAANMRAINYEAQWKLAKAEKERRWAISYLNSYKNQWPAEYIANIIHLTQNLT